MSPADANFVRVQVLLTPKESERFNAYCARNGFKKSTLIAKLVREYLDRESVRRARKARLAAASLEDQPESEDQAEEERLT